MVTRMSILSGITCLPFPEQACIQLVTGPLHCRNCGKAFSSPKCELSYRLLPWNPEMENFVGAPTGIEPASPAFRAGMLTTTPQHPDGKLCGFGDGDWTRVSSFPGRCANHYTSAPWYLILEELHKSDKQTDAVFERARIYYIWPSIRKDIHDHDSLVLGAWRLKPPRAKKGHLVWLYLWEICSPWTRSAQTLLRKSSQMGRKFTFLSL